MTLNLAKNIIDGIDSREIACLRKSLLLPGTPDPRLGDLCEIARLRVELHALDALRSAAVAYNRAWHVAPNNFVLGNFQAVSDGLELAACEYAQSLSS